MPAQAASAAAGRRPVLDVSAAFRDDCARRAHGQVSTRGKDQLLTHDKGSNISWVDYGIAAIDEPEESAHIRERSTVGS